MFRLMIPLIAVLFPVLDCEPVSAGRHLFILSGQSNMAGLDPQVSFLPAVQKEFGRENVVVVKSAVGGQPIRRWYKGWKPAVGDSPKADGQLYDRMIQSVRSVLQGARPDTVTFVWMQGERDAKEQHGAVYADSLRGLVRQLCTDLEREDVNCVIGRLSDFDPEGAKYPDWAMIRKVQVEVAESMPRWTWVDTDDLNDGLNKRGVRIMNDLHYSEAGYRTLGSRFAEQAIRLIHESAAKTGS